MEEVMEAVREALQQDDVAEQGQFEELGREPHVTFRDFEDDHLLVRAYYWFRVEPGESGWYDFLEHCDTVNRMLLRIFAEREITFAFPTRTLRLMNHEETFRTSVEEPGSKQKSDKKN
jgi:small-conductance mechanosensitive channel